MSTCFQLLGFQFPSPGFKEVSEIQRGWLLVLRGQCVWFRSSWVFLICCWWMTASSQPQVFCTSFISQSCLIFLQVLGFCLGMHWRAPRVLPSDPWIGGFDFNSCCRFSSSQQASSPSLACRPGPAFSLELHCNNARVYFSCLQKCCEFPHCFTM